MSLKKFALGLLLLLGTLPAFAGVQLFTNNAVTTLSAPASSGALSISVASSSLFPAPTGGNWFIATLEHIVSGVVTVNEIVKVTNVSGTTWAIVRAQEGTSAVAWLSGDTVALLPTAGGLGQFIQPGNITFPVGLRFSYGAFLQTANSTCALQSPAFNGQNSNIASVFCSSVGNIIITFSTPYTTNAPLCTVSVIGNYGSVATAYVNDVIPTYVVVYTELAATLANNIEYALICIGT